MVEETSELLDSLQDGRLLARLLRRVRPASRGVGLAGLIRRFNDTSSDVTYRRVPLSLASVETERGMRAEVPEAACPVSYLGKSITAPGQKGDIRNVGRTDNRAI